MAHWSPLQRYSGFLFLTDPIFALAESRGGERLSVAYYFGLRYSALCELGADNTGRSHRRHTHRPAAGDRARFRRDRLFHVSGRRISRPPERVPDHRSERSSCACPYLLFGPPWHFAGGAVCGMGTAAFLAKPKATA